MAAAERPGGEGEAADLGTQNAAARPGGHAKGGIDPAPGDPASPQASDDANRDARSAMRDAGFGDDKGAEF